MMPSLRDGDSGKRCDVSDQRIHTWVDGSSFRSSAITHERRAVQEVPDGNRLGCKGSWKRPRPLLQSSLRAVLLQDFLPGQLDRPPPAHATSSSTSTAPGLSPGVSLKIRLIPPDYSTSAAAAAAAASSISPAFSDANRPPSPVGLFSFCSNKLTLLSETPSDTDVERRHKRMLKNRESASRSRARKQAYVNQLELEIEQLLEENSRMKKELEKLSMEMAAKHLYPLRNKLHRSATAPF